MAADDQSATTRPMALVVDDHPDEESTFEGLLEAEGVRAFVVHPRDVEVADVIDADVVLVDFILDDWEERDALPAGLQPIDGAALISVFRSHLDPQVHPTAFALRTLQFDKIPSLFPRPLTRHTYARENNFEWIYDKADEPASRQIAELAHAVRSLPEEWPEGDDDPLGPARGLLQLPDTAWGVTAEADVLACHPPLHEMSQVSDGLAFIRWLLHRILPYPCFLYDENQLCARFGIARPTVRDLLSPEGGLSNLLAPAKYTGVLPEFLGPRWWRAGVERVLWDATGGKPFSPSVLRAYLNSVTSVAITAPLLNFPVLPLGDDYSYLDDPVEMETAIEVRPDEWPTFADPAWTTPEVIEQSPRLRSVVLVREADEEDE